MSALSALTTRGRCLLAGGVAAGVSAVILDERDLLRIAVFLVALPLIALLLTTWARIGLRGSRLLLPPRVPAGEECEVRLRLDKAGRIPSGSLLLEDRIPPRLGDTPRFLLERLRYRTGVRLHYPLRPPSRGLYRLGPLTVTVSDPFGLAEHHRQLAEISGLLVLPRTEQFAELPLGDGTGGGEDGAVRPHVGQGLDDAVVRQYRYGDDLRKVHWKATAHRDELMVRTEEQPWQGGTTVLLDRRAGAHRGEGANSSLEWAISFAASACMHLHRRHMPARLVLEDGSALAGQAHGQRPGDTLATAEWDEAMLDTLATLTPSGHRELVLPVDPGAGQELIAVLGALDPAEAAELARHRPRGTSSRAVLLDVSGWPGAATARPDEAGQDLAMSAELLRAAGWVVTVAGPGDKLGTAWSRLRAGTIAAPRAAEPSVVRP